MYNAYDRDIAVVNIFFGEETVMGGILLNKYLTIIYKARLITTIYHCQFCLFFHLIVTEMERRIRMGPIEFISSLGGLFGLCLGFSFISFFEIIYWATIALARCLVMNNIWFIMD